MDYNNNGTVSRSFAIWLPAGKIYRVVHIKAAENLSELTKSHSFQSRLDPVSYPALSISKISSTKRDVYDLLVLKPDRGLSLISTDQVYDIVVDRTEDDAAPANISIQDVSMEDSNEDISMSLAYESGIISLQQAWQSHIILKYEDGVVQQATLDLQPCNNLTNDVLQVLQQALPIPEYNSLRRRHLHTWLERKKPFEIRMELDCLWSALFEAVGCETRSLYYPPPLPARQAVGTQAYFAVSSSAAHLRFSDDISLSAFRIPQENHKPPPRVRASSQLAVPVLFCLHILGQSLKVDHTRKVDLELLVPAILRLCNQIAPEWADYWSRICPDAEGAWDALYNGIILTYLSFKFSHAFQITIQCIYYLLPRLTSLVIAFRSLLWHPSGHLLGPSLNYLE